MKDVLEIEQNILGAYISNEDLFQRCEHLVAESLFSSKVNRMTFRLIRALRSKGIKPDNVIINKELRIAGVKESLIPHYICEAQYKIQPESQCSLSKSAQPKYQNCFPVGPRMFAGCSCREANS